MRPVAVHVDWVPSNLYVRVSARICVCSCDIWRPIAESLGSISPNACVARANAWSVDIVATGCECLLQNNIKYTYCAAVWHQ